MRKSMALIAMLLWPFVGLAAGDPIREAADRIAAEAGGHRIVVIGEMHGTREAPAVVGALAARYATREPVLVGLEVWRGEHAALSAYMASSGGAEARARLRRQPFWDVPPEENDGRRTEDMLDLVDALRRLRAQGRDVALVPFDIRPDAFVDGATRDRDMADYLRAAFDALPRGRLLVLTGNVHARLSPPPVIDDGQYRTMTQRLLDRQPFAVNLTASSGEFWACPMEGACGPLPMTGPMKTGAFGGAYHFQFALPEYTVARLVGGE